MDSGPPILLGYFDGYNCGGMDWVGPIETHGSGMKVKTHLITVCGNFWDAPIHFEVSKFDPCGYGYRTDFFAVQVCFIYDFGHLLFQFQVDTRILLLARKSSVRCHSWFFDSVEFI